MSLFVFILGLCVGSFINCLIYRLNEKNGQGLISGRSECPKCGCKLKWYENIPLVSYAYLKGKCYYCHQRISLQYPLVEISTGILFLFGYQKFGPENLIGLFFYFLFVSSLIAIFVSDLLYFTVPDEIVLSSIAITFLRTLIIGNHSMIVSGLGAAIFFQLIVFLTRYQGMGMGDVKLAALIGLFLGYPKIIVALYLSFLTGAVTGVILIFSGKKRLGEHVPFGPFLTTATIISVFWGDLIWQKSMVLLSLSF